MLDHLTFNENKAQVPLYFQKRPTQQCSYWSKVLVCFSLVLSCKWVDGYLGWEIKAGPQFQTSIPSFSTSPHACMLSHFSHVRFCVTLWPIAPQVPLSMGILPARILEWVAMPSSRGSFWPRDWTHVSYISCNGRWLLYHWYHLGRPISPYTFFHFNPTVAIVCFSFYLCLICISLSRIYQRTGNMCLVHQRQAEFLVTNNTRH